MNIGHVGEDSLLYSGILQTYPLEPTLWFENDITVFVLNYPFILVNTGDLFAGTCTDLI